MSNTDKEAVGLILALELASLTIVIPLLSALDRKALSQRPKWKKRLPKRLSTNALNAHGMSIILPIEISTTDTSEVHSIKVLLDSRATGSFIDKDFVYTESINT